VSGPSRPSTTVARRSAGPWLARAVAPGRLLTPLGRGLLLLGLLAAVLSARFHWQEFTQLAAVAAGLLVLGLLWQLLPGAMVAELTLRHARVVEGSRAPTLTLDVQAGAAPMLFPKVRVPVGGRAVQLRLPFLTPFARHSEDLALPDLVRGVHTIGPVTYEKIDPVGLVSRRFETGRTLELFVAPRVTDLSVFAGGLTNDLDGATSQQLSMSDLAFHALREYVQGDDLRHVHWRSSAKAGQLLVRQYQETRRGHVTVLVDGARSSYPDPRDFELAVSVATSIALRAVRDDFDTYLRCGPHLAHSRDPVAMTDAACRFDLGVDEHREHAADAAETIHGTGLVVQVTGASRDIVELDSVAKLFGRGADWIVVRADRSAPARLRDSGSLRELSVPDLARLQELLARGMR
jgi:hypothetical protein